jgi:hypothetical protein
MLDYFDILHHEGVVFRHPIEDSFQLHPVDSGSAFDKRLNSSNTKSPQGAFSLDFLIRVGFVVLSSVAAHPRAQRMAATDERMTEAGPIQTPITNARLCCSDS